jgi:MFS transporter, DHA1 family, multidrug resistance protein
MSPKKVAFDALIKPCEINILDPAVLYTTFFSGLIYGINYTWFEVFPIVFSGIYGFSSGALGLTFISFAVGMIIFTPMYMVYFKLFDEPRLTKTGVSAPEEWLRIGLWGSWLLPAGIFIFGTCSIVLRSFKPPCN